MAAGDEVADPELWMCKPRQLVDLLRAAEQDIRRRQARALDIVAAIHRNRVGKALGHDNTMRLLQDNLLLSPTEAGRRLKRALNLCSSQALTGETLVPKLGLVSDAMRRGELADSHIDTILGIVNRLPARVNIEEREGAEASLVEHAKHHPARRLVELGQRIHDHLDPDGPAPPERENEKPRRELSLHTGRDGRLNFRGSFDGETGTLLTEILSPLAKPHPTQDGHRDERSVSQRNGDALAEALNLVADSGKLPVQGQERPHLTITLDWELLRERLGVAYAHTGIAISPESGRRLACDADITPMLLGRNSVPLNVARTERLIPAHLRKALIARDKGCARCGRPPRWCRGHHVTHWADGGDTCLENCVLLCDACHRLIHHSDWEVRIIDGIVEFIPPAYRDPERRPIRGINQLAA
ncbi:HNH endonuclease signature motif containing protein [Fodinicola feengrottensis]|uniref:HNH endonuclease signature motif containing protein n=2 Tax=Fodinicola feengrottensis TaxID=435914 RepID=A0ABN2I7J9_9ACTN